MALTNKSFLQNVGAGRYELHELLRQYGSEKLKQTPGANEATHDRHCAYYVAALQAWGGQLRGSRQQIALKELDEEIENARAAWNWAVAQS